MQRPAKLKKTQDPRVLTRTRYDSDLVIENPAKLNGIPRTRKIARLKRSHDKRKALPRAKSKM